MVDFDHHSDAFNENQDAVNAELRQKCPVAWNTNYQGFWYLSSYEAVSHSARDGDTFAHKYEPNAPDGVDYQGEMGIPRPDNHPALGIGEIDGPYHLALRHALAPFLSPGAVDKLRPFMEDRAHHFLDRRIEDGQMDLVLDYATARRADPQGDLTSFLIQFEFDGKRLDDEQLLNILWNLIAGGVDTTTSQTELMLRNLGTHPELRQQLIDHPELYRTATDEFLRYFSVNRSLSRTVARDVELHGQRLRKNDRVIVSWLSANHDEKEFERPDDIILDRSPNRHVAFGLGPHRCIGSHLARVMSEVMAKAVLDRIPDYVVDVDNVHQYLGNPAMTGLGTLPITFTPKPLPHNGTSTASS
ncbi:cytochrome P450 [Mycobacterium shigaense]|uniref:Cytochrome P450 n=1 Tax=Mycobacterium shigaense TaxID=722731 RepID=A0A1Z4EKA1_9MYCO|nr:cytochrome P450 [Mycobacterium shigaense]